MKILCAIVSHANSTRRGILRRTWVPLVPKNVDVVFFVGAQNGELEEGVVNLHCCDHHEGIPDKVREICRWAKARGYDFMWKCDDDVQLKPEKLAEIDFKFSAVILHDATFPAISGFLYGFDRECMEILSSSDIPHYANGWDCGYYQDEYWVADKLTKAGIPCSLITNCGVIRKEFERVYPPYWVVAVHGESFIDRSIVAFKQINGPPEGPVRRLGRK